jgi:dihydroorotate dehydrogenase electron transfer subunit
MVLKPEVFLSNIIHKKEITTGIFHIVIESPVLAQKVCPGQFVMIQTHDNTDPLLRRPFSLCGAEKDVVEILFQVRGKGTEAMSKWKSGQVINIMGPLGNGFCIPGKAEEACLVGGGVGIAPLVFLAQHIKNEHVHMAIKVFLGGKTENDVSLLAGFNLQGCDLFIATEDGRRGFQGLVSELFLDHIRKESTSSNTNTCIFGCGPFPMAKALADIAFTYNISCQLSIESRMACGVGACLGCVVDTKNKANNNKDECSQVMYKRVCVDGPVFDSREIDWERVS